MTGGVTAVRVSTLLLMHSLLMLHETCSHPRSGHVDLYSSMRAQYITVRRYGKTGVVWYMHPLASAHNKGVQTDCCERIIPSGDDTITPRPSSRRECMQQTEYITAGIH